MSQGTVAAPARTAADELLDGLRDGGSFGACPYTTAWLARARNADGTPRFPRSRRWLLDHQRPDGSWGGAIELPHDRTVCTLAAVLALTDRPADPAARRPVHAGLGYLRAHRGAWRSAPAGETMGFEMGVPYLLAEAAERGMDLPYADWADLAVARRAKLDLIPREKLLGEPTSLLYSLEAVFSRPARPGQRGFPGPPDPALRALERFAGPDGSLANSPSATAALLAAGAAGAVAGYLDTVSGRDGTGGVPSLYPTDAFETAWVLHHLQRAGLLRAGSAGSAAAARRLRRLRELLGPRGHMGLSGTFPLPDPDDSAMALIVLNAAGYDVLDLLPGLLAFEGERCFFTYPGERDGSVTPNARVLEALALRPAGFARPMRKIVDFLLGARREGAWWHDKWHVSPYYATAQVGFALPAATGELPAGTLTWLLDTQRPDGSWGWYGQGTPEETGCAVLNLDALARLGMRVPAAAWRRAQRYLRAHPDGPFPELWVGKSLYTPYDVARSTVLAATSLAARRSPPG